MQVHGAVANDRVVVLGPKPDVESPNVPAHTLVGEGQLHASQHCGISGYWLLTVTYHSRVLCLACRHEEYVGHTHIFGLKL